VAEIHPFPSSCRLPNNTVKEGAGCQRREQASRRKRPAPILRAPDDRADPRRWAGAVCEKKSPPRRLPVGRAIGDWGSGHQKPASVGPGGRRTRLDTTANMRGVAGQSNGRPLAPIEGRERAVFRGPARRAGEPRKTPQPGREAAHLARGLMIVRSSSRNENTAAAGRVQHSTPAFRPLLPSVPSQVNPADCVRPRAAASGRGSSLTSNSRTIGTQHPTLMRPIQRSFLRSSWGRRGERVGRLPAAGARRPSHQDHMSV
jgi:hypothetical protein